MTRSILKHESPTVALTLTVNVNLNLDRFLLFFVGVVWLLGRQARRAAQVGVILADDTRLIFVSLLDGLAGWVDDVCLTTRYAWG